ncbi:MAG: AraC family transcriptional regulator [Eubacteriales bacterium]|nr:AraC family transcriptional regulator [Eubacteriales bacterium]
MICFTELNSDRSENVHYNVRGLPASLRASALSSYPNYSAVSHWHDDVELIAVQSGHMLYNVNGELLPLDEGNGVFVNAQQLHYGFSDHHSECRFVCALLSATQLCSLPAIEKEYINPLLSNDRLPFLSLRRDVPWQRHVLDCVCGMYAALSGEAAELKILSLFHELWRELALHQPRPDGAPARLNHRLAPLKQMLSYIQSHYQGRVSLSSIAGAGSVGKTSCCAIFQQYLHQTPIAYLNEYRLRKGAALLATTDLTVTEICYEIGFSGASYFAEAFRAVFGCSPSAYRQSTRA